MQVVENKTVHGQQREWMKQGCIMCHGDLKQRYSNNLSNTSQPFALVKESTEIDIKWKTKLRTCGVICNCSLKSYNTCSVTSWWPTQCLQGIRINNTIQDGKMCTSSLNKWLLSTLALQINCWLKQCDVWNAEVQIKELEFNNKTSRLLVA